MLSTESLCGVALKMDDVNAEMDTFLKHYSSRHELFSPDKYPLSQIDIDSLNPFFKKAIIFVANVESNPKDPADRFLEAAERSGASWMTKFVTDTWHPEETWHGILLREAAISCRIISEQQIDQEIEQVKARGFNIGVGYNAIEAGLYGRFQEKFTKEFYDGLKRNTQDKTLQAIFRDLAKQENFHGMVQLAGLKSVLKHNPHISSWIKEQIISAMAEFKMPGNVMVPEHQAALAQDRSFTFSIPNLLKQLAKEFIPLVGYDGLGKAALSYAINDPEKVIPSYISKLRPLLVGLQAINNSFLNTLAGRVVVSAFPK